MERAVLHNAVRRLNSGLLDEAGLTTLLLSLCKRGTAGYYLRTRQRTDARGEELAATDSDDDDDDGGGGGARTVLSLTPLGLSLTLALEPAARAILTHSRVAVAGCGVASGDAVAAARAAGFAAATVALLERRAAEASAGAAFLAGLPRAPQHAEWRARMDAVLAGGGGCGDEEGGCAAAADVGRPAEVFPGLFLAAADMLATADPPPTAVVNLCPRMAGRAGGAAAGATAYLEIDCDDAPGYPIVSHADEVCSFVREQLAGAEAGTVRPGAPAVYVHCYGGINRSGALCVAYLVKEGGLSLTDAVEACHRRRPIILSNAAFRDQLVSYAFLHGKLA